jgi:alpha-D-xyloside xylohydrolase
MSKYYVKDNALCWKGKGEYLKIESWGTNALRVTGSYMKEPVTHSFSLLEKDNCENGSINILENKAQIQNGNIVGVLEQIDGGRSVRISFYDAAGKLLLREISRGGALNLKARNYKPRINGDIELEMNFDSIPDEKIYGMGQYQQDNFNLKNCTLELAHRNSQASIPFYLSDVGYGFLWHNPSIGQVNFSSNITQWKSNNSLQLDYWITAEETPIKILENYSEVTGKVPMMPEYGLGFWQCKLRYWNQEQLLQVAREYKNRQIPIDIIVCDFFHWPKMGDFRFEKEFFPDPKAMVSELKQLGIELMISVWPQIDLTSENYQEMEDNNYLIRAERGMFISMGFGGYSNFFDATNPEARAYVWKKCKDNYYDYGVKTFWLDEAEPEFGEYDYDNYRCYLGPYSQIGNIYPQKFSQTFYEGMRDAGELNVMNLVRCAWSGSQRYGALVWSGDIESSFISLRKQVVSGLQMAIAGIPWWTTDIGGFHGGDPSDPSFRELLIRWFQWGTFCPVMRLHGDRKPTEHLSYEDGRSNLFTGGDNEIWSFGDQAYPILKRFIELREKMRPYTREVMKLAHKNGHPVMRPMFLEFPADPTSWENGDQYMFGPNLLIAPILEAGQTERKVYLPSGSKWTNIFTREVMEGGKEVLVSADITTIPVFWKDITAPDWLSKDF